MSLAKQFNTRPLYQQVADEFVSRIITGAWAPGQSIGNEVDISRALGVSLGTVRKAFDILVESELLLRQQGRGTIVSDLVRGRSGRRLGRICNLAGEKICGDIVVADPRLRYPSRNAARMLDVNERTPILFFTRRRSYDGRLFMVEDVHLRVDARVHGMTLAQLEERARNRWGGHDLATEARESVRPERCNAADAAAFGTEEGFPILCLERVILSYQDRPLEVRYGRCHLGTDLRYESE